MEGDFGSYQGGEFMEAEIYKKYWDFNIQCQWTTLLYLTFIVFEVVSVIVLKWVHHLFPRILLYKWRFDEDSAIFELYLILQEDQWESYQMEHIAHFEFLVQSKFNIIIVLFFKIILLSKN